MASSYSISGGSSEVLISSSENTFISVQVVANASLDADITVKLKQTEDNTNYFDLAGTTNVLSSGGDSVVIESFDFTLSNCYLDINVGSATAGEVTIFVSSKKKDDSANVTATISGTVDSNIINSELDVNVTNELLNTEENLYGSQGTIMQSILWELQEIKKVLNKIYS